MLQKVSPLITTEWWIMGRFINSSTAIIIVLLSMLVACENSRISEAKPAPNALPKKELRLEERFPGPWVEEFHLGITRSLSKWGIRDCGQFQFKAPAEKGTGYLVRCSADGKTWNHYLVYPEIESVRGPLDLKVSLP